MLENRERMLRSEYGIRPLSFQAVPAGWSAAAWKVSSDRGDYFLKVFDKHKPSAESWVARVDSYMPAVLWLHGNTALRQRMTAPLLTRDGSYRWEDDACLYMVFPFIDGTTIADGQLTAEQVRQLVQIVAELHRYGAEIAAPTDGLRETFNVPFCITLKERLKDIPQSGPLKEALAPHGDAILRTVDALQRDAVLLSQSDMRYALCHTDIHGWNLMQAENLMLIDWEGLQLAPVEADLFSFTDTFFFGYAWEDFLRGYRSVHKGYRVNDAALRFYRFRRRLEDIHAFLESILLDDLSQEDMDRSMYHLKRECDALHGMG